MRWRPVVNGLPSPANHWLTEDANGRCSAASTACFISPRRLPLRTHSPRRSTDTRGCDMGTTLIAKIVGYGHE